MTGAARAAGSSSRSSRWSRRRSRSRIRTVVVAVAAVRLGVRVGPRSQLGDVAELGSRVRVDAFFARATAFGPSAGSLPAAIWAAIRPPISSVATTASRELHRHEPCRLTVRGSSALAGTRDWRADRGARVPAVRDRDAGSGLIGHLVVVGRTADCSEGRESADGGDPRGSSLGSSRTPPSPRAEQRSRSRWRSARRSGRRSPPRACGSRRGRRPPASSGASGARAWGRSSGGRRRSVRASAASQPPTTPRPVQSRAMRHHERDRDPREPRAQVGVAEQHQRRGRRSASSATSAVASWACFSRAIAPGPLAERIAIARPSPTETATSTRATTRTRGWRSRRCAGWGRCRAVHAATHRLGAAAPLGQASRRAPRCRRRGRSGRRARRGSRARPSGPDRNAILASVSASRAVRRRASVAWITPVQAGAPVEGSRR